MCRPSTSAGGCREGSERRARVTCLRERLERPGHHLRPAGVRLLHERPDHHPVLVDQEGATDGRTVLLVEDAVPLRRLAVRPEVRRERVLRAEFPLPGLARRRRVARYEHDLRVRVAKRREVLLEILRLLRADGRERERMEDEEDVRATQVVREPNPRAPRGLLEVELRGLVTCADRHAPSPPPPRRSRTEHSTPALVGSRGGDRRPIRPDPRAGRRSRRRGRDPPRRGSARRASIGGGAAMPSRRTSARACQIA